MMVIVSTFMVPVLSLVMFIAVLAAFAAVATIVMSIIGVMVMMSLAVAHESCASFLLSL